MSEARQRILGRLRAVAPKDQVTLSRRTDRQAWGTQEKIERFCARMTEVRAEVHLTTQTEWIPTLQSILHAKGARNLLFAPENPAAAGLAAALEAGGIRPIPYAREIEHWKRSLFEEIDAGFTGCRGAIAETGSLILWPDATEPRLLSLVPPIHCVLLEADNLYGTFAEAVEAQDWARGMPSNALLISGPSKSADIAQVLAYGVHGPKSLAVILVR